MIIKYLKENGDVLEILTGTIEEHEQEESSLYAVIEVEELPQLNNPFRQTIKVQDNQLVCVDKIFTKEEAINIRWIEINAIKNMLAEMDYKTHKFIDGEFSAEEFQAISADRKILRQRINELESEIENLKKGDGNDVGNSD